MKPKILFVDIETSPLISYTWGLFDQNVGLNQIVKDWHLLAFAAKWDDEKTMIYKDQRGAKDISNDGPLVEDLWHLLDSCDIAVAHNAKNFDIKKINARFMHHGLKPPKPYKVIDTLTVARRKFGFTSNKLEYLADKFNTKYKKLVDREFQGFNLWKECLAGNTKAWNEMRKYNQHDVLALEELYNTLSPWDTTSGLGSYYGAKTCKCGSKDLIKRGFRHTVTGKFQMYQCKVCASWMTDGQNVQPSKGVMRGVG